MVVTVTAISGMTVGFIAGLYAYRVSRRWCAACGSSLSCPACSTLSVRRNAAARRF
ncbi:hypothetical protein BDK92_6134 [Micromonospora pisi]|uniref:Uncharacterized protein n=1 Tax=Micromonospora pisi TaxID=589240 RepID=A0A495JTT3_9ACTN|nr:hypothetical protein BDK92_6134 [Micromonospora pisi]